MADAIVFGVGASAGLGGALCRRFARAGLSVLALGRTPDKLKPVIDEITRAGGRAAAVQCDVTVERDVLAAFDAAGAAPKVVVYNAGNAMIRPLLEMDAAFFEEAWRVGCLGGFLVGRESARRMVPAGRGTLIFTGATASLRARPPFTAFAAAKAGLRALAQGLAREFDPQGLHVAHVIVDGMIEGDQLLSRFPAAKERAGEDGMLQPDAIADAYFMLHAQPRSAWTFEIDLRPYRESF
jgi:NAD(P)-dependent dehydrogenase (short-subunit alcohol dehydrogenase family)